MAGNTFRGGIGVIAVDMTEIAISKGMSFGERELWVIKRSRCPTRFGGMTLVTRGRVLRSNVIGIGGMVVFVQVTGNTFSGQAGIDSIGMAEIAIVKGMSIGEWKEWMVKTRSAPVETGHWVTFLTIGGHAWLYMVGFCGGIIIFLVTIKTFYSLGFETKQGSRLVTLRAFCRDMWPDKRKPALPVQGCNVLNDPWFGGMATGAIRPRCIFMHIGMAVNAFGFCLGKYKGRVAGSAVRFSVTPYQGHGRGVVIKRVDCFIQLPAAGAVAYIAAYLKLVSVRGISVKWNQQESKDRKYDQWQDSHFASFIL
jgi:hypothetical protein